MPVLPLRGKACVVGMFVCMVLNSNWVHSTARQATSTSQVSSLNILVDLEVTVHIILLCVLILKRLPIFVV
jgi:hypothetical protein